MDATYHGQQKYLTVVDCGPSRFAIRRAIRNESDTEIVPMLRQAFSQFCPPAKLLCDNEKSFTSKLTRDFRKLAGVKLIFRCTYKPYGNEIVGRNHRTIKRMPRDPAGALNTAYLKRTSHPGVIKALFLRANFSTTNGLIRF